MQQQKSNGAGDGLSYAASLKIRLMQRMEAAEDSPYKGIRIPQIT